MSEYTKQANDFLKRNNISFKQVDVSCGRPDWDKNNQHYCYKVFIRNRKTKKSMTVNFWGSVNDYYEGKETAEAYDVLACLQKYDVGTIDNFISEFGYTVESYQDAKRIEKTYKAVCREYKQVCRVFSDCLDELCEIA